MEKFKIIQGFRNIYDIDRLRVEIGDFLSDNTLYINYLKEHNLKGLVLYSSDKKKMQVDFSFCKELSFLQYFECLAPLKQKSNIEGLYFLQNLNYLRWIVSNKFLLDYSKFTNLEVLVTSDYGDMINWDSLTNLKVLLLGNLKMNDCILLSNFKKMTDLKLSDAEITSISGLEKCENLERLELLYCTKIKELLSTLSKIPNLKSVSLKKCKNIGQEELVKIKEFGISLWVE